MANIAVKKIFNENIGVAAFMQSGLDKCVPHQNHNLLVPSGLIGFSGYHSYSLAPVPYRNLVNFRVLQSLENDKIVFLVLQLDQFDSVMNQTDLEFIAEIMNIDLYDLEVLLVATPKIMDDGKYNITLNTKAPIFVDKVHNIAMQYVLQSPHYTTRHKYCGRTTQ